VQPVEMALVEKRSQNSGRSSPWNCKTLMPVVNWMSLIFSSRSFTKRATGTINGGSWRTISAALAGSI
jgi:hypothetical protein